MIIRWSKIRKGRKLSDSAKEKISIFNKSKKVSKETKHKQSLAHLGKKNPMYGKDAWASINKIKKECKYCGLITNIGNYKRWHDEKCKAKY